MTTQTLSTPTARGRLAERTAELMDDLGIAGRSYYLDADGECPVHVLEAGSGDPVLFLHGGGSQATEWAPLLARLQSRFRCIALDRPGHGLSYTIDYRRIPDLRAHAADFVARALDQLGLDRIDLVGSSMGSFFGICFALAHPDRIGRLVLIGSVAGMDRELPTPLRMMSVPLLGPLIWKTVAKPTERGLRAFYEKMLVTDGSKLPQGVVDCGAAAYRVPGRNLGWWSLMRRFATVRGLREEHYLGDDLARVSAPTLFLWGDRDRFSTVDVARAACARMANARVEVARGAAHLPGIDEPDFSAERISAFLGSAVAPARTAS